jgi:hypothetical protein
MENNTCSPYCVVREGIRTLRECECSIAFGGAGKTETDLFDYLLMMMMIIIIHKKSNRTY